MAEISSLYIEAVDGCGEDAPPLVGDDIGAVFDGLGGAGAAPIRLADGRTVTNAYVASRIARTAVGRCFAPGGSGAALRASGEPLAVLASHVHHAVLELLDAYHLCAGRPVSRVSSSVVLPTTMACALMEECGQAVRVTALWAGDSRVYALDAQGLHQISEDDQACRADYWENLRMDAPMSNKVNLSAPFYVNARTVELRRPCAVFTCTDGCHMYFPHPLDLERRWLLGFCRHETLDEAMRAQRERYLKVSQDDCSLTVHVFADEYAQFRAMAQRRYAQFVHAYVAPPPSVEHVRVEVASGTEGPAFGVAPALADARTASAAHAAVPDVRACKRAVARAARAACRRTAPVHGRAKRRASSAWRARRAAAEAARARAVVLVAHVERAVPAAPGADAASFVAASAAQDERWMAYKPSYEVFFCEPLVRTEPAGGLTR